MKFVIIGIYEDCSPEILDECNTRQMALQLVREYRMAFGPAYRIYSKKVKNDFAI